MEKRRKMLEDFKQQLIEEVRQEIKEEYLYLYDTLSDCLNCEFVSRIERLEELLEKSDEEQLRRFAEDCEKASKEYAADWYDEDLEMYRSGYQWESDFEWSLRNIALGKNTINPNQAGYGI